MMRKTEYEGDRESEHEVNGTGKCESGCEGEKVNAKEGQG